MGCHHYLRRAAAHSFRHKHTRTHCPGSLLFRNSLLLAGNAEPNDAQCEALIRFAVETCERYFPAVQFVVWAGQNAGDALEAAMIDTWGEA